MNEEIKRMCKSLRLAYVAEIYDTIIFENKAQFLNDLFKMELELREKAKVQRLIKRARFISNKTLELYQWEDNIHFPAQIDKNALTSLTFLEKSWREGRFQQYRNKFKKVELIILDEMGYIPFGKEEAELLFQLITDWYEQKSLIITSNLEFSQWNRIFTDPRLTAALVDRIIHHAHVLSFTGDSYRITNALSRKN